MEKRFWYLDLPNYADMALEKVKDMLKASFEK